MRRFEGCTLAIIAGGQGRRLGGVVKAHLRLPDGRTILERMLSDLAPLFDETMIVSGNPTSFPGHRVVTDVLPGRGAPGGVHAACAMARTEWTLALASDLPFVSAEALRLLWDRRDGQDAVVARVGGRLQPLHGFYRGRVCAQAFGRCLARGDTSFGDVFALVRALILEEPMDPRSFENVNTAEDMARAGLTLPETG